MNTCIQPKLAQCLLPACRAVQRDGGVVRGVKSAGQKQLPYRMKAGQEYETNGIYSFMQFDAPTSTLDTIRRELSHNSDIIRHNIVAMPDVRREHKPLFHRCRQNGKYFKHKDMTGHDEWEWKQLIEK